MKLLRLCVPAFLFAALSLVPIAHAQDQKVIVTINDLPVTSFDIEQRINLWKIVGGSTGNGARKRALNEIIDDIAAVEETKKFNAAPTEKQIDQHLLDYAKGLKTDEPGLKQKLKAQGVSMTAMRQYLAGRLAFGSLLRGKYKEDFTVSEADVKQRLSQYKSEIDGNINRQIAKIEADPRRRAITVYELLPINFPIDAAEGGVTKELINSRAIEVQTYMSQFRGCKSARAAAAGIFNVKIGKRVDADAAAMNPKLKQALNQVGPGKVVGPIPTAKGVEAIAYCGTRKITPPKIERPKNIQYPTAEQVRSSLAQKKYDAVASKYSSKFRKGLLIEFRDPSYNQ
jgi:peptidyl-prolyl cis-trans isomerase SurA